MPALCATLGEQPVLQAFVDPMLLPSKEYDGSGWFISRKSVEALVLYLESIMKYNSAVADCIVALKLERQ